MQYKSYPMLAAYIDRVGAEQLSFKKFMVKENQGNYYTEKAVIKITSTLDIECNNKVYEPTKDERDTIRTELQGANFPTCVEATNGEEIKRRIGNKNIYEFYNRRTGGLVMLQQRVEKEEGGKAYIPWTLWSDGEWRAMEPERALPFWKPRKRRALRIMIHEGAKAAAYVENVIVGTDSGHPWKEELAEYEHWGIIGGALAAHRADLAELRQEEPVEVVHVCDNDWPGRELLRELSKLYGKHLYGVKFDQRWPASWDMADPMPERFFIKSNVRGWKYDGPKLEDLMIPATWATELVPNPQGRPTIIARKEFCKEWWHSVSPEVFIHHRWPSRMRTAEEFNAFVGPFSHSQENAKLMRKDGANQCDGLRYVPALPAGMYNGFGGRNGTFINTHIMPNIKPIDGDESPWLEYMEHLIPNAVDCHEALRWICTLLAAPMERMLYGMLLVSETQGVGKSTLGEKILAPLLGWENVSFPTEMDIVESSFNSWLAHKRLVFVHEIYSGSSVKAYNRMKAIITDRKITISIKYMPEYDIDNWTHIIACSNSTKAVKMSSEDRRWFVPQVTEEKKPDQFWTKFNDWLNHENGLAIILGWAHRTIIKDAMLVRTGEAAPTSQAKIDVIRDTMSPGQLMIQDLLGEMRVKYQIEPVYFTDGELVAYVRNRLYEGRHSDRLESPATLRKIAKNTGWMISSRRWRIDGAEHGRIITNCREWIDRLPASLPKEGFFPLRVSQF